MFLLFSTAVSYACTNQTYIPADQMLVFSGEYSFLGYYCFNFEAHNAFIVFQNADNKLNIRGYRRSQPTYHLDPDYDLKVADIPFSKVRNMTVMYGHEKDYPSFVLHPSHSGTYNFAVGAPTAQKYLLVNNDCYPSNSVTVKGSSLNSTIVSNTIDPIIFVNAQDQPYKYNITATVYGDNYVQYYYNDQTKNLYNGTAQCEMKETTKIHPFYELLRSYSNNINPETTITLTYERSTSKPPDAPVTMLLDWFNFNEYPDVKKSNKTVTIVTCVISAVILLIGLIILIWYCVRGRKSNQAKEEVIAQPLTAADGQAYSPQPVYAGIPQNGYQQPVYQQSQGIPTAY